MRDSRPEDAVITGIGVVTGLGYGLETCYRELLAGVSAVRETPDAGTNVVAGRASLLEPPYLRAEVPREMMAEIKFLNDAGELAVEATVEAMAQARVPEAILPERRGLYLSQMDSGDWSCMELRPGVVAATESFAKPLEDAAMNEAAHRGRKLKPHFMLESLKNNAFSFLATLFDLRGANTSVAGYAGATQQAIDMGVRALARGGMDAAVICGAAAPTSQMARAEIHALGLALEPGDAAATLVLERREEARARGADVQAALLGLGAATRAPSGEDGAPSVEALTAAARMALGEAELAPGELEAVIVPHLTPDATAALREALAEGSELELRCWQHQTGHVALATEAVELAFAARHCATPGQGPLLVLTAGLLGQAGAMVVASA